MPIRFMNRKVAEELCEVFGRVDKSTKESEMDGGSFIRVRVILDISVPLCQGRVISLSQGEKG